MIFSSPPFFLFLLIYMLFHLAVPARHRLALIIAGSTFFYGYWNPWYVWLPYLLLLIAFFGAQWIEKARGTPSQYKRAALVVSLLLLPLVVIKYTNFIFEDVLGLFFGFRGQLVHWAFPLGVSFITFTMIAYVVDVYRGRYRLETRPALVTGLVLFFPHLIAGPILRPNDLLPQLDHPQPAWRALGIRFVYGLAIFSVGLLKKLVFADTFSTPVRAVYEGAGRGLGAADYLLGWYGFCVQIYCDFSGYTDMAIGVAVLLGVRLPINFKQPYAAASIIEFWRRWHITLSTWLRDYIYIPLGGNRKGTSLQIRNVLFTMGLGGLWHGAHWTFVIWGLWHGIGIACAHLAARSSSAKILLMWPRWLKIFVTFHFVCVGFIFFRAADLATAWRVIAGPFTAPWGNLGAFVSVHLFELILMVVFVSSHPFDGHRTIRRIVRNIPAIAYWLTVAAIWLFAIAVSQDRPSKFIYFDF
jgi:alginate O-acetyltransferase complex protein AlgI